MKVQRINIYRDPNNTKRIKRVVDVVEVDNQLTAMKQCQEWFVLSQPCEESIEHVNGDMWRFTQEFDDVE